MKNLYKIAARCCQKVYENNIDLGTTEYFLSYAKWKGIDYQVLAVAGTNELADWSKNLNLWSRKGIKASAYEAAVELRNTVKINHALPLMVTGHSKAAATAIAYKKLYDCEWCIAFAPARCLRYWTDRNMSGTTIFIDPDDIVSKLGFISFAHPKCKIIKAENDHVGLKISDHFMDNWVEFVG